MNKTIRMILLAALMMAAVSCGNGRKDKAAEEETAAAEIAPTVTVTRAEARDVEQESTYASTVQAYAINNIAPQTASRIRKINVEVGDYVSKGQVLAEMDRLSLEQARLQLVNDSTEYSRIKALYEEGGVSKSDLDAISLSYNVRKTSYKNLEENTILRSPISGYVTARNYDRDDMYAMSQPLFTIQQVIPVKLLVGISESEYTQVKKGDNVDITVDAIPGRVFRGRIERLYPTIDAATHTFKAEVVVNNSDRALRPGMYARVKVVFGVNRSIVLPDQAIVKQEGTGQRFVYILNRDNTVSFVPVGIGRHIGSEYEVTSGIQEGATVVTKGQAALKDGTKVQVIK